MRGLPGTQNDRASIGIWAATRFPGAILTRWIRKGAPEIYSYLAHPNGLICSIPLGAVAATGFASNGRQVIEDGVLSGAKRKPQFPDRPAPAAQSTTAPVQSSD